MMKILHIASFAGNIGDHFNHKGLYGVLDRTFEDYTITQEEIRDYYFNVKKKEFNEGFRELCNSHDLVIFGGGNFFDIMWENSHTGTTFSIHEDILDGIESPLLFYGLGFDHNKGYNEITKEKFSNFIDHVNKKKSLVSVRNDGSIQNLNFIYGKKYDGIIHEVLDGALLLEFDGSVRENYVAINLACDMEEIRFSHNSYDDFVIQMQQSLILLEEKGIKIIFVPHIESDYTIIKDVCVKLSNYEVLSISSADEYFHTIQSVYANSLFNIAMRFHANIFSLVSQKNVIPIATYPKIKDLYCNLNLDEMIVEYDDNMSNNIIDKINTFIDSDELCYKLVHSDKKNNTFNLLQKFFYKNFPDKTLTYKKLFEKFSDVEMNSTLPTTLFEDYQVWLAVRRTVFNYLLYCYNLRDSYISLNRLNLFTNSKNYKKILQNYPNVKKPYKYGKVDSIFQLTNYYSMENNKYINTRTNKLEKLLIDDRTLFVIRAVGDSFLMNQDYNYAYEHDLYRHREKNIRLFRHNKNEFTKHENDVINEMNDLILETFNVEIDLTSVISHAITYFRVDTKWYNKLFKKTKPNNVIFSASYNNLPLIYSANKNNVETIEYQYSSIMPYHISYNVPFDIDNNFKIDTVWTWANFWNDYYKYGSPKTIAVGYNSIELSECVPYEKDSVLIISQASVGKMLCDVVKDLIDAKFSKRIIYKLHRHECSDWETRYPYLKMLSDSNLIEVADDNHISILEYINASDIVIGSYSTALFEAINMQKNVLIVKYFNGSDNLDFMVEKGYASYYEYSKILEECNLNKIELMQDFNIEPLNIEKKPVRHSLWRMRNKIIK